MEAGPYDVKVETNGALRLRGSWAQDGVPVNMTGWTALMIVDDVLSYTVASGHVELNSLGEFDIQVGSVDVAAYDFTSAPYRFIVYDLLGEPFPLLKGQVKFVS